MLKQVHFMEPIQHNEKLNVFVGVRGQLVVEAILFDKELSVHSIGEDPGIRSMHDVKFPDGSGCYFETDPDGNMVHFMCTAYVEFRNGMLVITERSSVDAFMEADRAKLEKYVGKSKKRSMATKAKAAAKA
jgi:hypothetical protein